MHLRIAILAYNRPELLRVVVPFLVHTSKDYTLSYHVYDNNSTVGLPRFPDVEHVVCPKGEGWVDGESIVESNARIGIARKKIFDDFLASSADFLLVLDDDILVTPQAIGQALQDLIFLEESCKMPSCIAFHPSPKRLQQGKRVVAGYRELILFDYTGEGCMLWSHRTVSACGNRFGTVSGGFADTQFQSLRQLGGSPVTRWIPPYAVQHLGIDGVAGSLVYGKLARRPGWVRQPFCDYRTGHVLLKDSLEEFMSGGAEAMLRKIDSKEKKTMPTATDRFPQVHGRVTIDRVSVETGKVVDTIHVQNLVVDVAKTIMSHLLAGDDTEDYQVSRMVFGTNGDAPTTADTQVKTPITPVKDIEAVAYPNASSVEFTATLDQDEANGFALAEAGLQADNGLVARVAYGPLTKSQDFIFVFRWVIYW